MTAEQIALALALWLVLSVLAAVVFHLAHVWVRARGQR